MERKKEEAGEKRDEMEQPFEILILFKNIFSLEILIKNMC